LKRLRKRLRKLWKRLLIRLTVFLAPWLIWPLVRSMKIRWEGMDAIDRVHAEGGTVIYAFWHQRLFPFVYTHRNRGVCVLISRHGDGEIIARIIERFGFTTARGSSTRGGSEALKFLTDKGRARERDIAITPDGPKGPRYEAKLGAILLASRTGLPLFPAAWGGDRYWRIGSWDRFMIPKPFSRALVRVKPFYVPPHCTREELECYREQFERELREITEYVDRAFERK
jgi:lysophospholipid acyltransferase (LPLAT)-like uncharacterized protein